MTASQPVNQPQAGVPQARAGLGGRFGLHAPATPATRATGRNWDPLRLAVAGMILTFVWRVQDFYPQLTAMQLPTVVTALSLLLFVINPAARALVPRLRHPVVKAAVVILGIMVLSVPGGVYPGYTFSFILNDHLKTFLMFILIVGSARGFADIERFALIQVLGAGLYSWMVITRYSVGPSGRLGDLLYYDANDIGMLLVGTLATCLYFIRRRGHPAIRIVAVVVSLLTLVTVVRTGSRGSFLGLIALGIFFVTSFKVMRTRTRVAWVAVLTLLFVSAGSDRYWTMMETLLHPTEDYNWKGNSESGRMDVWARGMGYMFSHPLTGVGAAAFPMAEGKLSPLAIQQQYGFGLKWSAAHNSFVQIGAELGVFGLAVFLAMLYYAFKRLRAIGNVPGSGRGADTDPAAMAQAYEASLVAYAVTGFFLSQAYATYLYSTLGIIVALTCLLAPAVPRVGPGRRARRR